MKCEEWLPLIEEYLDGELNESSVRDLRAHLASCGACAGEYKQLLKEQELYQSYIRDIEVTPALWATVQARIQQDGAGPGIFERLRRLAAAFTSGPRLSPVYAMLLVILAVAVTVIVMRENRTSRSGDNLIANGSATPTPSVTITPTPSPSATGTPTPSHQPPAPKTQSPQSPELAVKASNRAPRTVPKPAELTAEQAVREAEQKYVAAIAILSRDVNKHRSELDPAVAAKFEATLASIDFTIRETKRAVREHPGDPVAAQYMLAAYSEKLDVLREMAGQ